MRHLQNINVISSICAFPANNSKCLPLKMSFTCNFESKFIRSTSPQEILLANNFYFNELMPLTGKMARLSNVLLFRKGILLIFLFIKLHFSPCMSHNTSSGEGRTLLGCNEYKDINSLCSQLCPHFFPFPPVFCLALE